jgi:hypothetical protein
MAVPATSEEGNSMHHIASDKPVLRANLWGFAFGWLSGVLLGYGFTVRNHTKRNHAPPGNHTLESGRPREWPIPDTDDPAGISFRGCTYRDAIRKADPQGERELFTTAMGPDAFPVGQVYVHPGEPNDYTITRVLDLGSFQDIDGKRHQQWRVYGRPA